MRVQNRNILLLVDNASTHTLYENTTLTNIVIEHLPPNTTSHLQPCDQGIINSFKVRSKHYLFIVVVSNLTLILFQAQYRKLYLHNQVKAFDNFNEYGTEPDEINIKKCIKYVAHAWDNVMNTTIKNCQLKANIMPEYSEPSNDEMSTVKIMRTILIYNLNSNA